MKERGDSLEDIKKRKRRIDYEKSFIDSFDKVIINDNLEDALEEAKKIIEKRMGYF